MVNKVRVTIAGAPYAIATTDTENYITALAKKLDEEDFIKEKYYLEVSSPGIDRPLKKDKDLEAHYGQKVDLAFFAPYEGKKQLTAVLKSHDAEKLVLEDAKKKELAIERKLIASVRPHIDF